MSFLVLARKWRPNDFEGLVGQEHVVRALTNALTSQRLHHAWLFTGTRGVGKTTLSRILAKSLNCETGITAKPCGHCRACTEIDGGRFVDYVELDAASNRGVAEMTQLLEQAFYAPAVGRFKVYMIDEVHMLSGHAFNAMLKTLEEPPPHVKFILATTDPQKIPPTVLSRCLQFNLKQMPPDAIAGHLVNVLTAEQVPFELPALKLLGQSASGSMRDALSLTDQAIAYSGANLTLDAVRTMLGAVDQTHLTQLLQALADRDATAVLAVADALSSRGVSFRATLSDFAVLLSRISICQHVGSPGDDSDPLAPIIAQMAERLSADLVQLFYTVAVHGRQELSLAPDEYAGFVMVCLKMLAFMGPLPGSASPAEKKNLKSEPPGVVVSPPPEPVLTDEPPWLDEAESAPSEPMQAVEPDREAVLLDATSCAERVFDDTFKASWPTLASKLPVTGMAQQLATQSVCLRAQGPELVLQVATEALAQGPHVDRLKQVLEKTRGSPVKLTVVVGQLDDGLSAQMIADEQARQRQVAAEQAVANDPFVKALIEQFGGQVLPGSVKAVTPADPSVS